MRPPVGDSGKPPGRRSAVQQRRHATEAGPTQSGDGTGWQAGRQCSRRTRVTNHRRVAVELSLHGQIMQCVNGTPTWPVPHSKSRRSRVAAEADSDGSNEALGLPAGRVEQQADASREEGYPAFPLSSRAGGRTGADWGGGRHKRASGPTCWEAPLASPVARPPPFVRQANAAVPSTAYAAEEDNSGASGRPAEPSSPAPWPPAIGEG